MQLYTVEQFLCYRMYVNMRFSQRKYERIVQYGLWSVCAIVRY